MQLVVISSPDKFKSEIKTVRRLFDNGLETFHLRKPKFSYEKLKEYIKCIPEECHNRIIIHSKHRLALKLNLKGVHITKWHRQRKFRTGLVLKLLKWRKPGLSITSSFHKLRELKDDGHDYNYVFLSPIFESISKNGRKASFSEDKLRKTLKETRYRVFALGGVTAEKAEKVREIGFAGMAILGVLWNSEHDPVETFKKHLEAIKNKNTTSKIEINPIKIQF